MKKTIYTFCAGVFALLTIIGCSKSDDNNGEEKKQVKTSNFNIPAEAKAIIPEKFIGEMAANGMTIHEGTNPPNIEGIYLLDNLKFLYTSDPDDHYFTKGQPAADYKYKFYDQQGVKVKSNYKVLKFGAFDVATGSGAIISGSGNKFTVFLSHAANTEGVKNNDITLISGELTSQGIKNLVYVLTVTQKDDSNNKIMKVGTYRIFTHYESIAQKQTTY